LHGGGSPDGGGGARRRSWVEEVEEAEEEGEGEAEQVGRRGEKAAEGAGDGENEAFDMGVATVFEFHAQSGALLLAWASGTVRLLDVTDGSVVDEIKEDRRWGAQRGMLPSAPWAAAARHFAFWSLL